MPASSALVCSKETICCPLAMLLERAMNRTTTNTLARSPKPIYPCSFERSDESLKLNDSIQILPKVDTFLKKVYN